MNVHYYHDVGRIAGLSPDETRERVLDAAASVFADCGFDGARMAQIAKAADLSVGAIYNHYDSKAELLAAVVARRGADDLELLLASTQPGGILDLIAARGESLNDGSPTSHLLAEVILAARRDPEAADVLLRETSNREDVLASFVRLGQRSGDVVDDVDPATLARFCLMLGLGSLMIRALDLPPAGSASWAALIDRLVGSIRTREDQ